MTEDSRADDDVAELVASVAPSLRKALVAALGHDRGSEAYAEALLYAWSHQDKVLGLAAPLPYLFRVGRSRSRRRRRTPLVAPASSHEDRLPEPGLDKALMALAERQRMAVVLVVGVGWTYTEVADVMGISKSSVQRHVERGLHRLRTEIGVEP